jgi:hypothetical protein
MLEGMRWRNCGMSNFETKDFWPPLQLLIVFPHFMIALNLYWSSLKATIPFFANLNFVGVCEYG